MKELLLKYTNKHSRFAPINGILVHYRDEGDGFPILLLHGSFSSLHTFEGWTKYLKKDFRVLRMDLIGFGLTGPCHENTYTIQNHLRYICKFLDMMDIKKCHIAGNSLGGWLAWEFALKYPRRVEKIILLDAAGFIDPQHIPLPFKMARNPLFGRVVKYAIQRNILEGFVKQVYGDKRKATTQVIDRYYDLFSSQGNPEAFIHFVNSKLKDHTHYLKKIQHPTLIIWGSKDTWLPIEHGYRFKKRMPNAKMIIYKGVGHIPMEEVPRLTAKDAKDFLHNKL